MWSWLRIRRGGRARVEFGGVGRYRAQVRDERPWRERPAAIWREYRIGARRLRAAPLHAAFSILTLALGIGITTAVYSIVYHHVWPPMGVADPDRLVAIRDGNSRRTATLSLPDFRDLAGQQRSFQHLGAAVTVRTSLSHETASTIAAGEIVSGDYFGALGVWAARGRLLGPADDRPDAPPAAVISAGAWRRQFGSDPAIVGSTVRIAQRPFTIVGVVAEPFVGVAAFRRGGGAFVAAQFWVPLALADRVSGAFGTTTNDYFRRDRGSLRVVGRTRTDVSSEQATSELLLIGQRLDVAHPLTSLTRQNVDEGDRRDSTVRAPVRAWTAGPALDAGLGGDTSSAGWVILGLPALVFLIACTNLANLMLSRGMWRRQSVAVRRALGASRGRVMREEMAEGVLIAIAGGLLGLAAARLLLVVTVNALEAHVGTIVPHMALELPLVPAVLLAAMAATLLAMTMGSLVPAWQLTRTSLRQSLANGGEQAVPRWRGRGNLIALQVGASVGLFLIAFSSLEILDELPFHQGPRLGGLAVATLPLDVQQYPEERARALLDSLVRDLADARGIAAVAVAGGLSGLTGVLPPSFHRTAVSTVDGPFSNSDSDPASESDWGRHAALRVGTPQLFDLLGLGLLEGRGFTEADTPATDLVAVINEDLALELFGTTRGVVGRPLLTRMTTAWDMTVPITRRTIVGVAPVWDRPRTANRSPELYLPLSQHYDPNVAILLRADAAAPVPVGALRAALRRADPTLAALFLGPGQWLTEAPAVLARFVVTVAHALAAFALVLAMSGLYGVLSDVVSRRTREIGVRLALGADSPRIARMVLKDGLRPVVEGLAIGLGSALVLRQFLRATFVRELSAVDPIAFSLAVGLLTGAGVLACVVPARRASRVAPNVALRDQ